MRPIVYISGPITLGDQRENVRRATAAFRRLHLAGLAVLCPHWSWLAEREFPELVGAWDLDLWIDNDLPLIARCDCVLRLPGKSAGADRECDFATEAGIPLYTKIGELIQEWTGNAG